MPDLATLLDRLQSAVGGRGQVADEPDESYAGVEDDLRHLTHPADIEIEPSESRQALESALRDLRVRSS